MKYYFDLDNTLIRTHHLRGYMGNPAGRAYLAENPNSVETSEVNPRLKGILKNLGSSAIVISNSPQNYAEALLKKHGFPNIRVIGNAGKPCSEHRLEKPSLYVGDEPLDILFAHEQGIPGVAYIEGAFFSEEKINQSQPSEVARTIKDLEDILSGEVVYKPRQIGNFTVLADLPTEDIRIEQVQDYHKPKTANFKSSGSQYVLAYKRAKDFTWQEIERGQRDLFFYQDSIKSGAQFSWIIGNWYKKLQQKIESLGLQGTIAMIGLPNSMPEFAYLSDPNYRIAMQFNDGKKGRTIYRVRPVKEAHLTGLRSARKHIGTLAIHSNPSINLEADNIILFDDITTTGTQFKCAAALLRKLGYKKNIIGLALGKTVDSETHS